MSVIIPTSSWYDQDRIFHISSEFCIMFPLISDETFTKQWWSVIGCGQTMVISDRLQAHVRWYSLMLSQANLLSKLV